MVTEARKRRPSRPSNVYFMTPGGYTRHLACWERMGKSPQADWQLSEGPCTACDEILREIGKPEERLEAIAVTAQLAVALRRASRDIFDLAKVVVCKSGQWTIRRQELRDQFPAPCKRFEVSWAAAHAASQKRWSPQNFFYLDGAPPWENWRPIAPILPAECSSFSETVNLKNLLEAATSLAQVACAYDYDVKLRRDMCLHGRWDSDDYAVVAAERNQVSWLALAEEFMIKRRMQKLADAEVAKFMAKKRQQKLTEADLSKAESLAGKWRRRASAIRKEHPDWLSR